VHAGQNRHAGTVGGRDLGRLPAARCPGICLPRLAKRIQAVGAHIAPGKTISITLGIEPTTTTGSSTSDVEVLYHDGGSRFELRTNLA
jgi:hypothetical protein